MTPLERVVATLEVLTPQYTDEYGVQRACADALEQAGIDFEREIRLNDHDRIDLVAWPDPHPTCIGIEVKVDGARRVILRQLMRYAQHPVLDALVLVTTRGGRHQGMPVSIAGKPVRTVSLILGGF